MSAQRYMGPSEVQSLILGQWVNIIGREHDGDRGRYGRDRDRWGQQQQYQQYPYQQYQSPYQQYPYQSAYQQYPYQQYQSPYQQYPYQSAYQQYQSPYQQYQSPYQQYQSPYQQPLPASAYRQPLSIFQASPSTVVRDHRTGNWIEAETEEGFDSIPPRSALVQDPGPDRAGREVLPMSTGVAILPTQSAQITARPQRVAFRPERVFISAAGTSGGAADWVVNDIKIGNRSQFSQSGDVPGDMFATNAIDGFVSFETAQTAMDVVMVVTYIGLNESGVPFFASIVGTAAI